jgi:predicted ribosomally synthesized peptide with nif11-like leader
MRKTFLGARLKQKNIRHNNKLRISIKENMPMTNYTPKLVAKAKAAKSADELFNLAKENGIEITEEEAKTYFAQLNANDAISDDELDAVAGGGSCPSNGEEDDSSSGVNKVTCLHCQGPVSRSFTKCPWCGKTIAFF